MTAFFDSNVLIYAYSTDAKRARALAAVSEGGLISVQVLNEFTNVLRNKQQQEWSIIEAVIRSIYLRFPDIVPLTSAVHAKAILLARDHRLSFYDALIVAAATEAGCDTLWTEDMQHGRIIEGLTIRNPFAI